MSEQEYADLYRAGAASSTDHPARIAAVAQLGQSSSMTSEEPTGFESLSDEALLMADELMKRDYPLPDRITESSIRLAHLALKTYEKLIQ